MFPGREAISRRNRLGRLSSTKEPKADERGVRNVAPWRLGLGLAAAIGLLALMDASPGAGGLVVFFLGLAALGVSGALWGRDSRTGGDWAPNGRARAMRG